MSDRAMGGPNLRDLVAFARETIGQRQIDMGLLFTCEREADPPAEVIRAYQFLDALAADDARCGR